MATETEAPEAVEDTSPIKLSKHKREGADMDITPMIDIVFLLLIFFLVASKMDKSASVTLPNARNGSSIDERTAIVVLITATGKDKVVVSRGDGSDFSKDLETQETELMEYIEAGLAGTAPFDEPKKKVMLKAAGEVRYGEVARVAEVVGKVTDEIPVLHIAVLERT